MNVRKPETLETLLLLALWDLGGEVGPVLRTAVRGRVSKAKAGDAGGLLQEGWVTGTKQEKRDCWQLTQAGKVALGLGLGELNFEANVGKHTVNGLLHWIQKGGIIPSATVGNIAPTSGLNAPLEGTAIASGSEPKITTIAAITSYETFTETVLEIIDRLDKSQNLNNVIPIYQVRRILGTAIDHQQFNQWLLEMQANDLINLLSGDMPELTPDIADDSLTTALGYIRYYIEKV
jgi:hypothetical protein